jgi:hypothetical protein
MSTARIPDGTPRGLVQLGLAIHGYKRTPGRANHPVKPRSAVVAAVRAGASAWPANGYAGGERPREIKSAPETRCGAGGGCLGNPCPEAGGRPPSAGGLCGS